MVDLNPMKKGKKRKETGKGKRVAKTSRGPKVDINTQKRLDKIEKAQNPKDLSFLSKKLYLTQPNGFFNDVNNIPRPGNLTSR